MDNFIKDKLDLQNDFGINVFNEKVMQARLPKEVYKIYKKAITNGYSISPEIADVIANAMKDWALEKGATHYTHWFQPLTGFTAEKHDSFISINKKGDVILEFSGKQLVLGEPDASSFPNGGLRTTFEARGYTAWDATSPAFIKEDINGNKTLCVPTAFCSYTSMALDKKTPLLRSMSAVSSQALRVIRALGNFSVNNVVSTVGAEQEYFLVDRKYYAERLDLKTVGRTLFGAPAPKGQEMDDHYFGAIKDRVSSYMADLDNELWKLGIPSKTRHNEAAPAQFEMAPIFTTTNISTDQNQLVMETMKRLALRHDLVCLLHEKPYAGINGSGKHNNWSLSTDAGVNLLEPGETPHENRQFLLLLAAIIRGVDKHADLLRASAGNSGNDLRLGAAEAPPAIISIFLGEELEAILNGIAIDEETSSVKKTYLKIGVETLPPLPKDNTDRNRTSPLAFTGNKFEFRMVGSSASVSGPNVIFNTIMAEEFDEIATRLEKSEDSEQEAVAIIKEYISHHQRVIFNGNGYSEEWVAEAAKRGLPNVNNTVDSFKAYLTDKAAKLFDQYKVFSADELNARYEIYTKRYSQQINIEGLTAINMLKKQYLPAVVAYSTELANSIQKFSSIKMPADVQKNMLEKIIPLTEDVYQKVEILEKNILAAQKEENVTKQAEMYRDDIAKMLHEIRIPVDKLEMLVPYDKWPVPSYSDLLFNL